MKKPYIQSEPSSAKISRTSSRDSAFGLPSPSLVKPDEREGRHAERREGGEQKGSWKGGVGKGEAQGGVVKEKEAKEEMEGGVKNGK